MINKDLIIEKAKYWKDNQPFPHLVIDNFFDISVANKLESEFPPFESDVWHTYNNAIEMKKLCNNWNKFPNLTYQVFHYLNSEEFVKFLSKNFLNKTNLYSDYGLNGGGWHIHAKGGKLNTHLDYSLHPKIKKQRKLNLIVYLNSNWEIAWKGSLGLWDNASNKRPGKLIKEVPPLFNRAVIFDTTCNSWHGLPTPLACPDNEYRKSIAVYYLTDPPMNIDQRGKALFAPTKEQENNQKVLNLIKKRSNIKTAESVYGDKD